MNDNAAAAQPLSLRARLTRGLLAVSALALAYGAALVLHESYAPQRALEAARYSGWLAAWSLLATLCVTPLTQVWLRFRKSLPERQAWRAVVPATRRALGIAAGALSLLHACVTFAGVLHGSVRLLWAWPQVRAGACALIILLALTLTSFPFLVRALRLQLWKELHRLAYAAAAFTALHVALSAFAPAVRSGAWLCVLVVMLALRLWPVPDRRGTER
ncbi:MAG TPA: ferric reductase-like transmembrane domain-containing protein [Polyangiales bacterium]